MTSNQDLLAELELTMVPSPRTHPDPRMYVPPEELETAFRSRSFWCSLQQQTVEVEFETKSTLGFSRLVGVRRCSGDLSALPAGPAPGEAAVPRRVLSGGRLPSQARHPAAQPPCAGGRAPRLRSTPCTGRSCGSCRTSSRRR
jgi:hypothetical protein